VPLRLTQHCRGIFSNLTARASKRDCTRAKTNLWTALPSCLPLTALCAPSRRHSPPRQVIIIVRAESVDFTSFSLQCALSGVTGGTEGEAAPGKACPPHCPFCPTRRRRSSRKSGSELGDFRYRHSHGGGEREKLPAYISRAAPQIGRGGAGAQCPCRA
jgi:hypothetical protein